jgi:PLP dependent protein
MIKLKQIMNICENLAILKQSLPESVKVIVVSKTQPVDRIMEVYQSGHRIFGENRVQELVEKHQVLPGDIEWHFIGHLQTNKVKYIAPFVHCIHSIDSGKLLEEVSRSASKSNRMINCLLQFHIAGEVTKYGLDLSEAKGLLGSETFRKLKNIRIAGVMGMATFTDETEQVRKEFRTLRNYFKSLRQDFFLEDGQFREISMGMSGDYLTAVEEGSTMIRIGTAIFGERTPH